MTALLLVLDGAAHRAQRASSSWASTRWSRSRADPRLEAMRDERPARRRARAPRDRRDRRLHLDRPGRDHDDLDRHRRARRARVWPTCSSRCSARVGHGLAVAISVAIAYLIITSAHIVAGELVPKIYAIDRAEARRPPRRPRRCASSGGCSRRSSSCSPGSATGILRWIGVDPDRVAQEGAARPRSSGPSSRTSGTLDPGEAGMLTGVFHLHEQEARQVMTPIPAVVTVDTSEDVETALRRCISSGHTRLLVTEDENQDRVRGIVHSNTLARQLMAEGPHAVDRAARPRRADRPGDEAARRPARRPPAPALLDGRRDRRVRPRRRGS